MSYTSERIAFDIHCLTLHDLHRRIGLARSILNWRTGDPHAAALLAIVALLGASLDDLVTLDGERERDADDFNQAA